MKKLLMVCLTAFLISTVLTGCGMFEKANGVILYGEEQQIIDSLEREKDELVKEDHYKIKIVETDGQRNPRLKGRNSSITFKEKITKRNNKSRKS